MNENSRQNFTYSVLLCLHNNMERVVDPHFGEEEMSLYSEITWSRPFSCQGRLGSEPQWACSKDCFFFYLVMLPLSTVYAIIVLMTV